MNREKPRYIRRSIVCWICLGLIVGLAVVMFLGLPPTDPDRLAAYVLDRVPLIDTHMDLLETIRDEVNGDLSLFNASGRAAGDFSFSRAKQGRMGGAFFSVFVPCQAAAQSAVFALDQVDLFRQLMVQQASLGVAVTAAETREDVDQAFQAGQFSALMGLEGGHMLGQDPATALTMLRTFRRLGVRYMTLTHSCDNFFAQSSVTERTRTTAAASAPPAPPVNKTLGLSNSFGRPLIREMNRIGMIVDLSHTAQQTMMHALNETLAPVMFSHSNARALCNNTRNVPDSVLPLIKRNNGIVCVTFYPPFLNEPANLFFTRLVRNVTSQQQYAAIKETAHAWLRDSPQAPNVSTVADHIDYFKRHLGEDHICLGGDFEGTGNSLPRGLTDVSMYPRLFAELASRGYSEIALQKLAGLNVLRVLSEVDRVAEDMQQHQKNVQLPLSRPKNHQQL